MKKKPVAFITGASRGIGRGIALELARSGFDIVANATSFDPANQKEGLGEVKLRVEELGASFAPAPGNIADLDQHENLLETVLKEFGKVDVLVCNAGIAPKERLDILETTPESFDRVLSVNTRGTFFLAQRFARHMVEQVKKKPNTHPVIVFISSISTYYSSTARAEYCMSKAAISHCARIFAHRLAEHGIYVYDVRPGIIKTDMTAKVKEKYDKLFAAGLAPQKRWGLPEDVGRTVAALARGDFAYSTGITIEVSGGMQIHRLDA